jgi:tRNA threonylcarbamoyl adenosine modification protein (Sua5/YciO/YrdC/YwlC family)
VTAEAIAALRRGEVIGIPTDTVYGVASLPSCSDRLFELKRRPPEVQVPVLIADPADASLLAEVTPVGARLIERFWPGALTVVLPLLDSVGTVGLRCPDNDVVRSLCRSVGPLATTSANLHGQPPLTTAEAVRETFPGLVVVDGGFCEGAPSTVVDATGSEPVVLREGRIPAAELLSACR